MNWSTFLGYNENDSPPMYHPISILTLAGTVLLLPMTAKAQLPEPDSSEQVEVRELVDQDIIATAVVDLRAPNLSTSNTDLPSWVKGVRRMQDYELPYARPFGVEIRTDLWGELADWRFGSRSLQQQAGSDSLFGSI